MKNPELGEPIIKCYSKLGAISALLNRNDNARKWLAYNYFNLLFNGGNDGSWWWMDLCGDFVPRNHIEWECCPYISWLKVIVDEYSQDQLHLFLDNALDSGQIIYCNADRYYLDRSISTNPIHRLHDVLILRSDDTHVECRDYFNNQYQSMFFSKDDVKKALMAKNNFSNCIWPEAYLLSYQDSDKTYESVDKLLDDYLSGTEFEFADNVNKPDSYQGFGIDIYPLLREKIVDETIDIIDIRPFYALKDHFTVVEMLMGFEGYYDQSIEELKRIMNSICLCSLKNTVAPNSRIKEVLNDRLYQIECLERILMENWRKNIYG